MNPESCKFAKTHEWAFIEGNIATIGISDFAQKELNDIVFVELPEVGKVVEMGKELGVLESVKTASDIYSPLSGKVIEVNSELENHPEWVNQEPHGNGWIAKIQLSAPEEIDSLLSYQDYLNQTESH